MVFLQITEFHSKETLVERVFDLSPQRLGLGSDHGLPQSGPASVEGADQSKEWPDPAGLWGPS